MNMCTCNVKMENGMQGEVNGGAMWGARGGIIQCYKVGHRVVPECVRWAEEPFRSSWYLPGTGHPSSKG